MEFNPLDLLASAAELQQKNDDEQDSTMTRSNAKSPSSRQVTVGSLKENKLNNNNNTNSSNNNHLKNKETGHLLRKIKIHTNPELEKMLNEHNYGNAKKSAKYERDIDLMLETKVAQRSDWKETDSVEEETDSILGENDMLNGQERNGTEADDSLSQCESEVCFTCGGHVSLNKADSKTETSVDGSSFGPSCGCQTGGISGVVLGECARDSNKTEEKSEESCSDCSQTMQTMQGMDPGCSGTKSDQQCCKCSKNISQKEINRPASGCSCSDNENDNLDSCKKCQILRQSVDNVDISSKLSTTDIERDKVVASKSDDITAVLIDQVSDDIELTPVDPDINISLDQGDKIVDIEKPLSTGTDIKLMEHCDSPDMMAKATHVFEDQQNTSQNTDYPMEVARGMSSDLSAKFMFEHSQKSERCNFKSFNLDTSLCTDSSVSNVHLLSPDRRNPDSVGVVESPGSNVQQEMPNFEEPESENESAKILQEDESSLDCATDKCVTDGIQFSSKIPGTVCKLIQKVGVSDNSANKIGMKEKTNIVFRFDSDHCYAGMPDKENVLNVTDQDASISSEKMEVDTPLGSAGGYLSQDSGYEDVSQSPDSVLPISGSETPLDPVILDPTSQTAVLKEISAPISSEPQTVSTMVPVLLSVNSNGSLTVQNSNLTSIASSQPCQVFAISDFNTRSDAGLTFVSGSSLNSQAHKPILLSPVGKTVSPILVQEAQKETSYERELESFSVPNLNSELAAHLIRPISPRNLAVSPKQVSPPKYGKFRIGTFASFSNTGMDDKIQVKSMDGLNLTESLSYSSEDRLKSTANSYLGSLVQKVKSNLMPLSLPNTQVLDGSCDHIQHDHDYCMKNLMPSVVSSSLESKLLKETLKTKSSYGKGRKSAFDERNEAKTFKRKRSVSNPHRDESDPFDVDDDSETYSSSFVRPKTRAEKYIEQKSVEPKVKITGSSNFQDQFVYFMNTKKRSRRRESRDSPTVKPLNNPMFVPPKPGDIIVPHLTDQDIENLRQRSKKLNKNSPVSGYNSLRNEFMAAKLSNSTFSPQPADPSSITLPPSSITSTSTSAADDEKNIINTILSMGESMAMGSMQSSDDSSEAAGFNESMEMYGQGLGGDIMNLLPEQMNLTKEQMDLLFSAVDVVQNSSPGFISEDKLAPSSGQSESTVANNIDPTFGQFPVVPATEFETGNMSLPDQDTVNLNKAEKVEEPQMSVTNDSDLVSLTQTDGEDEPATKTDTVVPIPESLEEKSVLSKDKLDFPVSVPTTDSLASLTEVTPNEASSEALPSQLYSDVSQAETICQESLATTSTSLAEPSQLTHFSSPVSVSGARFLSGDLKSSPSVSSSMSLSEIPLSSTLDLLSTDLPKTDILGDNGASTTGFLPNGGVAETRTKDYNAPWIVTVSMYWNDLPAVMMNNHPYVRLVDIHKQILPAKDTGILKKRCQLMGIPVENCSEMQRYFLVQYGRAFNSKSTLIISKDNAKDLIGYYVDPQPRTVKPYDHKSIIDHRREQLRRIALARRASMKAQKSADKSDEDARAIRDVKTEPVASPTVSVHPLGNVPSPVPAPYNLQGPGTNKQRATRHKKINFLELLRGDSGGNGPEEDPEEEDIDKKVRKNAAKKPRSAEKKLKLESYLVETDGETTETNESEFGSSDETNADSGCEFVVMPKPVAYHLHNEKLKPKAKLMKYMKRPPAKKSALNIKSLTGACKIKNKNKAVGRSTILNVKVMGKNSVNTLEDNVGFTNWSEIHRQGSVERIEPIATAEVMGQGAVVRQNNSVSLSEVACRSQAEELALDVWSQLAARNKLLSDEDLAHNVHKIGESPPEQILETFTTKEMETNTDFDTSREEEDDVDGSYQKQDGASCEDGIRTNTAGIVSACVTGVDTVHELNTGVGSESVQPETVIDCESRSQSPALGHMQVMRRKEIVRVSSDEISLRIIHKEDKCAGDASTRSRTQIGEVFVDRYDSKKSLCIRCYTCRKLMTVDNFSHHLHDVVSGGLIKIEPRAIFPMDPILEGRDKKMWEIFQRKKEMFENNNLPSPANEGSEKMFFLNTNHSLQGDRSDTSSEVKPSGPRVINTPVSPLKKQKNLQVIRKASGVRRSGLVGNSAVPAALKSRKPIAVETMEGVRSSSRKRKMKQLYPFEEYSYAKFPRLQQGHEETNTSTAETRE